MGHTNSTANLSLPQFIGTDKPTWLGDVNGAFSAIDTYVGTNDAAVSAAASDASSAISQAAAAVNTANTANTTAGNASTAANNAIGVANTANAIAGTVDTKVGLLADLHTTDRTSIVNAINEVKDAEGDLTSLVTTDKSSLVAAINEAAGGSSANIRYNSVAHTIEVYDNGSWQTAIANIYPGSYKGAVIYEVTMSSPYTVKVLYFTLSISADSIINVATDAVDTVDGDGSWKPIRPNYGIDTDAAISLSGSNVRFTPVVGSHYKSIGTACNNNDADIIAAVFPQSYSALTAGAGTQVSVTCSDGYVAFFVINA